MEEKKSSLIQKHTQEFTEAKVLIEKDYLFNRIKAFLFQWEKPLCKNISIWHDRIILSI